MLYACVRIFDVTDIVEFFLKTKQGQISYFFFLVNESASATAAWAIGLG